MIRAAVRYAEGKGVPPPELSRYLKWKTWGVLPLAGGTDDQRAGELDRMLECANAFELWKKHKAGKLKDMTKKELKYLMWLKEEIINGR